MTKRVLRVLTIVTLLGMVLSVTFLSVSLVHSQRAIPQVKDSDKPADNGRLKTLQEVAQERDVEREYEPESDSEYGTLSSLTADTDTIVFGKITKAESSFDKSGDHIETKYSFDTHRVLKANALPSSPLLFWRPGGVVYINGHRISVKVKGNEQLKVDNNCILFLHWSLNRKGYIFAGGMSGAFLVEDDTRVKSLAISKTSEIKRKYRKADLHDFVSEILSLLPQ